MFKQSSSRIQLSANEHLQQEEIKTNSPTQKQGGVDYGFGMYYNYYLPGGPQAQAEYIFQSLKGVKNRKVGRALPF